MNLRKGVSCELDSFCTLTPIMKKRKSSHLSPLHFLESDRESNVSDEERKPLSPHPNNLIKTAKLTKHNLKLKSLQSLSQPTKTERSPRLKRKRRTSTGSLKNINFKEKTDEPATKRQKITSCADKKRFKSRSMSASPRYRIREEIPSLKRAKHTKIVHEEQEKQRLQRQQKMKVRRALMEEKRALMKENEKRNGNRNSSLASVTNRRESSLSRRISSNSNSSRGSRGSSHRDSQGRKYDRKALSQDSSARSEPRRSSRLRSRSVGLPPSRSKGRSRSSSSKRKKETKKPKLKRKRSSDKEHKKPLLKRKTSKDQGRKKEMRIQKKGRGRSFGWSEQKRAPYA